MKILVLGGTQFVGRHIVEAALNSGHEVTLFNRGKSNPELFPNAETLIGDRDGKLDALKGRSWEAVIDVNGYVPRLVRDSAHLLVDLVEIYAFISTIAVYADHGIPSQIETAPLAELSDPTDESITTDTYGGLKAFCEQQIWNEFPDQALILRPGYIVGPHDHTDRFTYWVRRISQGGEMLAPGSPEIPIQFIDGRDLAEFTLRMTESRESNVYNVTGPKHALTWGQFFTQCKAILDVETQFTWVDETFLSVNDIKDRDLPMWPTEDFRGSMETNIQKAISAGLTFRSLKDTVEDTLEWHKVHGVHRTGLEPARESELLEAWHDQPAKE